ncbi:hypothetical protein [Arthrobacter sp. NA-172]|uniref:hypothetical protein n=1 Tax=Arthrobacter sp. NA-172 TaxID=3367524 RepID=UPI003754F5B2
MTLRRSPSTADVAKTPAIGRVAAVLAAAAVLIFAPGIAQAAFKSSTSGSTSASTLKLATPTASQVTSTCNNSTLVITLKTPVTGANYHQLIVKDKSSAVVYTGDLNTSNHWTYTLNNTYNGQNGNYTFQIRGQYHVPSSSNIWTGSPYTKIIGC